MLNVCAFAKQPLHHAQLTLQHHELPLLLTACPSGIIFNYAGSMAWSKDGLMCFKHDEANMTISCSRI